jgi:hypothetical protein
MLENTKVAIKNGQSRETDDIAGYTRDEDNQNKNTTQYVLDTTTCKQTQITNSNMASCIRFEDKRAIYRWYNLIRTCD